MIDDGISRVAIFGTGQMGPGIGVVCALAGCSVTAVGRSAESLMRGQATADAALALLSEHEIVSRKEAEAARSRLMFTQDGQRAAPADLVIESIVEHLPTKQQFFRELEAIFGPDAILASNTSGIRISEISALMQRPERAVTTHFWNPAHLMPLVDVAKGEKTAQETVDRAYHFLLRCGKKPVVVRRDVPGQLGNRLQHALVREALYIVQEGIASPEDVETAVKYGAGLRFPVYGPLEHADAVGLDMTLAVQSVVVPALCNAVEALPILHAMIAQGKLGVKTGQGFYNWQERDISEVRRQRDLFLIERAKAEKKGRTA